MATLAQIHDALPAEGLFAGKEWLVSPEPFPLTDHDHEELDKLGYRLTLFNKAANLLYQQSVKAKQPAWIADYLDRGKPTELIELARGLRSQLPAVIRPDIILTETGWTIAELDTVPGGIGLTGWLNQTYASAGHNVLGGANDMIEGFRSILPDGGEILVSEESATYRPEMQWLANQLNAADTNATPLWTVGSAENPTPASAYYRFFELFDLPNLPHIDLTRMAMTPPPKPFMEEKLWFALFWMRPLREFWRRELSERHFLKLQQVIPYTWIMDPEPLPHFATLPGLDIQNWGELKTLSQKQREFVCKISGFSDLAWGSRGVYVAQDLPQKEWAAVVDEAIESFPHHPYILQRFHKGRQVAHPYFDRDTGEEKIMHGRVRLCPYYFVSHDKAQLSGALATIVPADKKILHGMTDAILCPAAVTSI
ncbi:MAG: hypothetical protein ABIT76_14725 [Chthoniobacterales bacterium]